jgi:hypothetical protein
MRMPTATVFVISSALAESGMSHLVNQRMGKGQPVRWSAEGAHQLLQVRCAVLDGRLDAFFRELHPKFRPTPPVNAVSRVTATPSLFQPRILLATSTVEILTEILEERCAVPER